MISSLLKCFRVKVALDYLCGEQEEIMNYMWKFLSNFKEFYNEINSATLTGAIDVIVVQQEDGTYSSSPFHVRFGKIGVLRSREKVVDIEINGQPVDIHMKLGESGEAFFVEETDDPTEVPSYLATSPIPVYSNIRRELELLKKKLSDEKDVPALVQVIIPSSNKSPLQMESSFESATTQLPNNVAPLNESCVTTQPESAFPPVVTDITSNGSIKYEAIPIRHPQPFGAAVDEPCEVKEAVVARTVKVESTVGEKVLTASSLFRPIKSDEDSSPLPHDSESGLSPDLKNENAEVMIDIDDDKAKMKKKRKRKSTIRRKQQKNKEVIYTYESQEVTCKDIISSEDQNEIFQMDVLEDSLIISSSAPTTHSKIMSTSLQLGDDLCNKEKWQSKSLQIPLQYSPYSDGEISPAASPSGSRPSTPKSDTEYEIQRMEAASQTENDQHQWSWTWGELPVPPKVPTEKDKEEPFSDDDSTEKAKQIKKDQEEQRSRFGGVLQFMGMSRKDRQNQESEGIYLDDLNAKDPEMAALYFSRNSTWSSQMHGKELLNRDEDMESGNGSSLPQSPHSVEGAIGGLIPGTDSDSDERNVTSDSNKDICGIAFSLCGNLSHFDGEVPFEKFEKTKVTYENFCNNPNLFNNPDLVVRIDGKYYNWQAATPILMSLIVFQRPLPDSVVNNLVKDHMPKKTRKAEGRSWWYWRRSTVPEADSKKSDIIQEVQKTSSASHESNHISNQDDKQNISELIPQSSDVDIDMKTEARNTDEHSEKYKKSLRLTSDQIAKLKLKQGPNEVVFSVTTAYQGTTRCKCHIYLWKYDDQIVVSDIDGTITKSDVLGHILPIVGKSWAQSGVAQLFTQIKNNGYQFLYLSARAIGQARITREYLRSIRQGDVSLPDGPLLLSPSSLISALHREVIEKKPEEFKISCLRDIQALFISRNPFYSGYGNKINDVWAYRAIGIPMARIFTINPKGELKHERNRTFQSSYSGLSYVVDHVFPPLVRSWNSSGCLTTDFVGAEEFSSYTYWRYPLPDIEIDLESEKSALSEK